MPNPTPLRFSQMFGKLTPGCVAGRTAGIPGFTAPIKDAGGYVAGVGVAGTKEAAIHNAAFLAAAANLCDGLPVGGILDGRFAVVEVDPKDPFGGPNVPVSRFTAAIIGLLHIEEFLQDPSKNVVFEPGFAIANPGIDLGKDNIPSEEKLKDTIRRAEATRAGILQHLARMLDLDFQFTPKGGVNNGC